MKNVRKKSENIRWKLWILSAGIALLLMAGGVRIHKLKEEKYEVEITEDTREKAQKALDRMLELAK